MMVSDLKLVIGPFFLFAVPVRILNLGKRVVRVLVKTHGVRALRPVIPGLSTSRVYTQVDHVFHHTESQSFLIER